MSTQARTVEALCESLSPLELRARRMFGEYGLYLGEKMVAVMSDDQLFLKPTPISASFLSEAHLCPPYPQAKPYFRVPDERWGEKAWLTAFFVATEQALPVPKVKPVKKARAGKL